MRRCTLVILIGILGFLPAMGCSDTATTPPEAPKDVATTRDDVEARLRNPYNTPEKTPGKKVPAK